MQNKRSVLNTKGDTDNIDTDIHIGIDRFKNMNRHR